MAENKEYMIHQEDDGSIQISEDVLASIASTTALEVDGVSALMSANVSDLMGGKKMTCKGVRVELDGEQIVVGIFVAVRYGCAISRCGQKGPEECAYRAGGYDRLQGGGGERPRGRHQLQLNNRRERKGRTLMTRSTAREIAIHLAYQLSFTELPVEEFLDQQLSDERFAELAAEDDLYADRPNTKQEAYIRRLVSGVAEHAAELDADIEKYARGWRFERISLVASAIMRVAMYEILYMADIPQGAAISEAVTIAKKYETPEVAKFINGILGSFARGEVKEKD